MSKATIHYHDIGDYLSQTDKLKLVRDFKSFLHLPATIIEPNEHGDWISVRNDVFGTFIPIISEEDKSYHATSKSYFVCVSGSVISSRDAWCFNFSELKLQENIQETILHYNEQRKLLNAGEIKEPIIDSQKGSWSQIWLDLVKKNFELIEEQEYRVSQYRPFTKTNTYFGKDLNARRYQLPKFFPNSNIDNLVICVTGKSMFSFSTLITNKVSEFGLLNGRNGTTQCFPLYYYEENNKAQKGLFETENTEQYTRKDAISDFILERARKQYNLTPALSKGEGAAGLGLSKEDIFYYVYGFLHSPEYRETFANDLKKMLPRLPLVEDVRDFWAFSKAGRQLADLHLNYENVAPYPVNLQGLEDLEGLDTDYHVEKMRFPRKDQKETIVYNSRISINEIPAKAYQYVVNGKSAIEWIMERYQITTHKESGIRNDPNDWAKETGKPRYILDLLLSIINVSVQTVDIVASLPKVKFE